MYEGCNPGGDTVKEIRNCVVCGKPFVATNGMQKVCKDAHFGQCVVCGKQFEIPRSRLLEKDRSKCCSRTCSAKLRKQTCNELYGGNAPAVSDKVRQKMEETTLARFGVRHAAQSSSVKRKMSQTTRYKYGVDWYPQTSDWKIKTSMTSEAKYGSHWPTASDETRNRTINTNLDKYGCPNPMQNDGVKFKFIRSHMQCEEGADNFFLYRSNPREFIQSLKLDHKPTIYELSRILGVNETTVGSYLYKYDCRDAVEYQVSVMEQEVRDFIYSVDPTIRVNMNIHNIIPPNEIDIYLPEYRIGIECNPTATHNSTVNVFDGGGSTIYPSYHLMKTRKCENVGVFLFHIFGPEWRYSRPIIESMIRNLLEKPERKIYARSCEVRKIDWSTCRNFLDTNHRQGNANSKIRLGLYLGDELVSVMTFGKMRNTIGTDGTDLSDCWELVRFCSLLNTSVVGGASKLFKYFIRNYKPTRIRSFSDRAHTRGRLYEILGFVKLKESTPGYVWVDSKTDISYHRYNAQKHNLKKFLHDEDIDLSKTEKQIMEEHGFLQMFDCGTILWEYQCN